MAHQQDPKSSSMLLARHRPNQPLHVYEWGKNSKRTLVLVNAYAMPVDIWHLVIAATLDVGYHILTWDTVGVFESDPARSEEIDFSFDAQVLDLMTVIERSRSEQVEVVAWCTGALVTLRAMYLYPKTITKAAILGGCFNLLPLNAYQKSYRALMTNISRSLRHAELHRQFLDARFTAEQSDAQTRAGIAGGRVPEDVAQLVGRPFQSTQVLYNYSRLVASYSLVCPEQWLDRISSRILILVGDQDNIANRPECRLVSQLLPNAKSRICTAQDHFFHYREVDIARDVARFLHDDEDVIGTMRRTGVAI